MTCWSNDGNTAGSRSYFDAVHVHDEPDNHGDVGGWYEATYRRIKGSWRLVIMRVKFVWTSGQRIPGSGGQSGTKVPPGRGACSK
jgi:hypothetical protein